MRVLLVIHGYPPRYNAGSEVYTQALARELASRHEVRVFTRQKDPFLTQFATVDETDAEDRRVRLRVVNNSESRDRYRYEGGIAEEERLGMSPMGRPSKQRSTAMGHEITDADGHDRSVRPSTQSENEARVESNLFGTSADFKSAAWQRA